MGIASLHPSYGTADMLGAKYFDFFFAFFAANGIIESDRRRLIQLEAEIADHLVGVGGVLAGSGEIAVDEHRVGWIQA